MTYNLCPKQHLFFKENIQESKGNYESHLNLKINTFQQQITSQN